MRPLSALDVAVDCLAVARLTRLVTTDEVPFGPARDLLLDTAPDSKAATLVSCSWCSSMWCAALAVFARYRWPRAWGVASRALAASQVTGTLAEVGDR